MSRISLMLVAAAVAAGVVGCAQCDTCDDFPAPCTGPNCGQNSPGILDMMPPGPGRPAGPQAAPTMGSSAAPMPADDTAGPAPVAPPPTPAVDPTTPPPSTEPAPK